MGDGHISIEEFMRVQQQLLELRNENYTMKEREMKITSGTTHQ